MLSIYMQVIAYTGNDDAGKFVLDSDLTLSSIKKGLTQILGRPVPTMPWEQQTYGSTIGGYGSGLNYNSGYGSGMYGSSYGGLGGSYGGGLYGNNMYRGGYGGGLYGGSGMYGGGMYNGGFGGPMGGYGMGMGGPNGNQDPNNPFGAPPSPPGFWISFLRVVSQD
ncbi:hypothetical protein TEA_008507 [Camellia sinensis var. sinensis]|uniref:Peroxin-13 n=2 Tax=Camellia sinensis TaxID=4442 RepID=A0A4S4EWM9_CAMSN|nr:hypothetical protein TEA_008507 [Camellia sinensis var. sinensis]